MILDSLSKLNVLISQALEDAAEALVKVRADIMAEVEHQHGMECIEQKHYRRAVKHFQEASKFNYAPAAYNLALCYERGLGTSQDFKMVNINKFKLYWKIW